MNAAELASKFRIAGVVEFVETEQGLAKAEVSLAGLTAELFVQGAQVTAWQPAGQQPVLFTSPHSNFAPGKAIRGGIPIVFPWFGVHASSAGSPQHGFARTAAWRLDTVEQSGPDQVAMELSLESDGSSAAHWPEEFATVYRVTFGKELLLGLDVHNRSNREFIYEEAFHTYFAVSDVHEVTLTGLEQSGYIDKTAGMQKRPAAAAPLSLRAETDSVYLDTQATSVLHDPGWQRHIIITKSGAASTIVWNPWAEKAAAMTDLGQDQWRAMICVETGNVAYNRVRLAAGAEHQMTTRIAVDAGP